MKTTLYVALERLIDMSDASCWKLNQTLVNAVISHRSDCRLIAAFAPHRFGLIFETREEIDEAWRYIRLWLAKNGLVFEHKCVLLKNDADTTEFDTSRDAWWLANSADFSARVPHLHLIHEVPVNAVPIATRLRRLLTAALFPYN